MHRGTSSARTAPDRRRRWGRLVVAGGDDADSIKRSREGIRAVALALLILAATAIAQALVFVASGSVALLADLIHNAGDAATAIPLGVAFALRSAKAQRFASLAVVADGPRARPAPAGTLGGPPGGRPSASR